MTKIYTYLAVLTLGLVSGYYLATKFQTPKTETKTVTQVQERIVTRIVKRSDGTTETTIDETRTKQDIKTKTVPKPAPNWFLAAGVDKKLDSWAAKEVYSVTAHRRILGPVFVGARLSTEREVGLSVGIEF